MAEAYLFDAVRTPRGTGKARGSLYVVRPTSLMSGVLRALAARNGLDGQDVDDVIVGCVTQTGEQGGCLARFAALEAGFDPRVAGVTVNRFCASGLQAVHQAVAQVVAGQADLVIAGGVESMSRVPIGTDGGPMLEASTLWRVPSVPQGIAADLLATLRGFSREQVDAFALQSQQRARDAVDGGRFDRSLVPACDQLGLPLLQRDEYLRSETTLEQLSALRPAFEPLGVAYGVDALVRQKYPGIERIEHVHTAGNSSGIVDGAAAVLVASAAKGQALGLRPRARIRAAVSLGDDPTLMLDGPIPATRIALQRSGVAIDEIDLFEVNEAFAAVPLAFMQAFDLDPSRVNVVGGAIALGHPLGATGAILLGTLLDELERRDLSLGLVTMCVGGGMGIATVVERV